MKYIQKLLYLSIVLLIACNNDDNENNLPDHYTVKHSIKTADGTTAGFQMTWQGYQWNSSLNNYVNNDADFLVTFDEIESYFTRGGINVFTYTFTCNSNDNVTLNFRAGRDNKDGDFFIFDTHDFKYPTDDINIDFVPNQTRVLKYDFNTHTYILE